MLVVERCEGSARNRQTYVAQFGLLEYVQEDTYRILDEPAREAQDRGKVAGGGGVSVTLAMWISGESEREREEVSE